MDRSHWTTQEVLRAHAALMVKRARQPLADYNLAMLLQLKEEIAKRRKAAARSRSRRVYI